MGIFLICVPAEIEMEVSMDYQEKAKEFLEAIINFRKINRKINFLEALSFNEMAVFWAIKKISFDNPTSPYVKLSDISELLKISKPALSQIIKKLEDKELVERIFIRSDRRITPVRFTEKGTDIFKKENEYMLKVTQSIIKKMGEEDTETFISLLRKLYSIVSEEL